MNTQAETWLFLEDSSVDRRHMVMAVADINPSIRLLQASSMAEAKDLLEKHVVSVFLTDFYLRNGITISKFIAEMCAAAPRLSIVVVTGQSQGQDAPYSAGADAVIPKMESLPEFSKAIAAAVRSAKHARSMEHREVKSHNVFVPKSITAEVQRIIHKPSGNVLISSESGMGRSTLARHLAKTIVSENPCPNGAGKSTTIKLLCGILKASSGECRLLGMPPGNRSVLRKLGLVFGTRSSLAMHMTARQCLILNGVMYGLSESVTEQRVKRYAEQFGNFIDWHSSGGQLNRESSPISRCDTSTSQM